MREGWREFLPKTAFGGSHERRVHVDSPEAVLQVAGAIFNYGVPHVASADELVLLCIGTDRSTGDALGPLVGSRLTEGPQAGGYTVLGTLDNPVHASNLADTLEVVNQTFRNPFVVAVDASLGRVESVGLLTVGLGSLKPGAGVNKTLPAVGQVYVTGVVNVGGFMEYLVLQNTRLSLVVRMARIAAQGIDQGLTALVEYRSRSCSAGSQV